jgi:hypothetical protein
MHGKDFFYPPGRFAFGHRCTSVLAVRLDVTSEKKCVSLGVCGKGEGVKGVLAAEGITKGTGLDSFCGLVLVAFDICSHTCPRQFPSLFMSLQW